MSILDAFRRVRATLSPTVCVATASLAQCSRTAVPRFRRSRSDRSAQMRRPIVDIDMEMDF
jgi:hypothetical protein